jgi:hypothetical protein
MQVLHYDLRCGLGEQQQSAGSSRRSGSRLKLLLCQGYSKPRGPSNRVSKAAAAATAAAAAAAEHMMQNHKCISANHC